MAVRQLWLVNRRALLLLVGLSWLTLLPASRVYGQVPPYCSGVTLAASPTTQAQGEAVRISAVAAGCSDPEYLFVAHKPISGPPADIGIQAWSRSATAVWNTADFAVGTVDLLVAVHEAGLSGGEKQATITYALTEDHARTGPRIPLAGVITLCLAVMLAQTGRSRWSGRRSGP